MVTRKATHSKNCEFVRVLKCNAAVAKNRKILPHHKRVDRKLLHIHFATSAILQIRNESLKCQKESEFSFDYEKVISTTTGSISFMVKTTHFISTERRNRLKSSVNEEV